MRGESYGGPRPLSSPKLSTRVREARELGSTIEDAIDEIGEFLRVQTQVRPYVSLGGAAAVGYVLGGGIPTRVIGMLAALGSRFAVEMFLRELVGGRGTMPQGTTSGRTV
jgi:hypothetical protein